MIWSHEGAAILGFLVSVNDIVGNMEKLILTRESEDVDSQQREHSHNIQDQGFEKHSDDVFFFLSEG